MFLPQYSKFIITANITATYFVLISGLYCNAICLRHLGVIINEDNKHQIDLQERIKIANKTYFMLQKFF